MFQRIYDRIKWNVYFTLETMNKGLNSFLLLFCFIHFFLCIANWLEIPPSFVDFERDGNILYIGKILLIQMIAAYYAGRIVRLEEDIAFMIQVVDQVNKEKRNGRR